MFELLGLIAFFVVGGLMIGAFVVFLAFAKLLMSAVLLPLKIIFLPIAGILGLVATIVVLTVGVALVGALIAVVVPLAIVAMIVVAPIALVASLA
jgi:hypothetical protein